MEAWEQLQPTIDRLSPVASERGISALSPAERNVLLAWSYPAAVNDGGHASFFYNAYGEHAHETVQALNAVGAPEFAALLSRAIDLFPGRHVPSDSDERNASFDALPDDAHEVLEALDQQFYELGDDELFNRLLHFWSNAA
jgi:hypothetical protein